MSAAAAASGIQSTAGAVPMRNEKGKHWAQSPPEIVNKMFITFAQGNCPCKR